MRCFCPPDRFAPSCVIGISSPRDCARTKSSICAASSVCHSSLSVASARAMSRLSRRVPANRWLCAETMEISRVSDAAVRSRIWCDFRVSLSSGAALLNIAPSTSSCIPDGISDSSTSPSYPTSVPASSWTAVDLPEPDGPTIAVTSPGSARRATLRKA